MAAPHVIGASEVVAMGHIGPARKRYDVLPVPATATEAPVASPGDPSVTATSRAPDADPGPSGSDERRGR